MNSRQWDKILLVMGVGVLLVFVISTQDDPTLLYLDNPWYLNRGRLIWMGEFADLWAYNLTFPTLVGALDLLVQDVVLAGMLTNALILGLLMIGVYSLGLHVYGRRTVSRLAVVFLLINLIFLFVLRLFWAVVPFMTAIVWCLLAARYAIRRPGIISAILLGLCLALAIYTRLEGIMYSLLIPIAAFVLYRQGKRAAAMRLIAIAGVTLGLLVVPYGLSFLTTLQNRVPGLGSEATGIFSIMSYAPAGWDVMWRRATDLWTATLRQWHPLAWLTAAAGALWAAPRYRAGNLIFAALLVYILAYSYVLSIWPFPPIMAPHLPFFALLLASAIDQGIVMLGRRRLLAAIPIAIILASGLFFLTQVAVVVPPFYYRQSPLADVGHRFDVWRAEQGWQDRGIHTFCGELMPFSRAQFFPIYRLQFATAMTLPENVFQRMRERDELLALCDKIDYSDWQALFENSTPPELMIAGQFDQYTFYEARPDEAP